MGHTYVFECPKCTYRASVAGGASEGEQFRVQTILCRDCRELYDAVMALRVAVAKLSGGAGSAVLITQRPEVLKKAPPFQAVLNRLPLPVRIRQRWQEFKPACPVEEQHRVRLWKQPDKCPRCGVFMEANALPFRRWD